MTQNLENLSRQIESIAREAGTFMAASTIGSVTQKGDVSNVVTDIDVKCQQLIIERCQACLPGSAFLAEEEGRQQIGRGYTWVIDPIDGTTNYLYGYRHSCVSIGLYEQGKGLVGVIYDPYLDECFVGIEGVGSFCNGRPIHVSENSFREALVMAGTAPYSKDLADRTFAIMKKLFLNTRDIRRSGSAALDLCYLASGRIDAYYELSLQPWDYGAGAVIIRNAGGLVEGLTAGAMEQLQPTGIIATNGRCHREVSAIVRAGESD